MNSGKLVGVVALARDGRSFVQSGALIVCGVSRMERFRQFLRESGSPDFLVRKVYSEQITASLEVGGDPWAFDPESCAIFAPIAARRHLPAVRTIEYGFADGESMPYVIYARPHADN